MPDTMFVRDIVNRGVMNDSGEKLGRIKALAINMESGRIAYAVLAFGAFPNRTKLYAVPWELFTYSSHDKRFILNVPKKILQFGLGFDTLGEVAAGASFVWLGDVYEYYSDKPDWDHKRQEQTQLDIAEAQRRREEILKAQQ
ncbi:MAG: PRC-barrel domain-containing protein [Chloroflexi bacterium]|nr:PRC-barrel domain-containing protein [Chloroflexota bacterium]